MTNFFKSLFQSQDSKYFLKTSIKVMAVPIICTLLVVYSLWMYIEMNYSFFIANGYAHNFEMKDVFVDYLMISIVDYLPWVAIFYVMVFFMGIFLSHLILRPFDQAAKICQQVVDGKIPDTRLDPMSARKLINRSVIMLVEHIANLNHNRNTSKSIPEDLKQISKPQTDGIFYIQYGAFVLILALITSIACYFFIHHMHEAIIDSAMKLLKSNATVRTFLTSQGDLMEQIVWTGTSISAFLYFALAKGIISDIEGVSYGYLRDIRDIVSGNTAKRLRPRFSDPGKNAANQINDVLDLHFMFSDNQKNEDHTKILKFDPHSTKTVPPHFIQAFKSSNGESVYRIVTSDGKVIEGLSYEQVTDLISRAS